MIKIINHNFKSNFKFNSGFKLSYALIIISTIIYLLSLPAAYIGSAVSAADTNPVQTDKIGYNSLSKFNISHAIKNEVLEIEIKSGLKEGVDAFIDNGRLIIKFKNADGSEGEESYALSEAVNENGVKTTIKPGHITITAPLIARTEHSGNAIKAKIDRMKKWHSLDKDIDSLFNFDDKFFSNNEIFGRNFFDDEMKRINKQMQNMMKMQRSLSERMNFPGAAQSGSSVYTPQCKVSQKIENETVVITIEGTNLDNLEFKVEDDIFKIHNKISGVNEESSENQISKMNFHSSFAQSFSLPAKVDGLKMKINKSKDKIKVVLPIIK